MLLRSPSKDFKVFPYADFKFFHPMIISSAKVVNVTGINLLSDNIRIDVPIKLAVIMIKNC